MEQGRQENQSFLQAKPEKHMANILLYLVKSQEKSETRGCWIDRLTGSSKLCHWNGRINGIRESTTADRTPCIVSNIAKMKGSLKQSKLIHIINK